MVRLVLRKAMFPSRLQRWCTPSLKTELMRGYLQSCEDEPVNAVGIRGEESERRAAMPVWEWVDEYDCEMWRPIHDWTEEDVVAAHHRAGLPPNPLYLEGCRRVGCYPCIFARKSEIRAIARQSPERIQLIADLELAITDRANERVAASGREPIGAPGWFQSRKGRTGEGWPIAKVVEWARTSHGGLQSELFEPHPSDRGCMRWGLCETHEPGLQQC